MFRKYRTTARVYRQGYTTESGYKKSGYVDTGKEYIGHLKAQTINRVVELGSFGKVYAFHTDSTADIVEGDRLKINGDDYDVKGVSEFDGITFKTKQVLINKA